jgi:D-alanine-D-alanine ligase
MNIAIITGGNNSERKISLESAAHVQKILSIPNSHIFDYPTDRELLLKKRKIIDVCIPIIHGKGGEDGEFQLLLQEIRLPYVFSGPKSHQQTFNKRIAKNTIATDKISVAKEFCIGDTFIYSIFVKPISGGSSIGTAIINSSQKLEEFIRQNPTIEILAEERIIGREFSVGVIDYINGTQPLPIIEIIPKGDFFDYNSKYNTETLAKEICPADIPDDIKMRLQDAALSIHTVFNCKDISRSDFIVRDDTIYFLEVNTIPGMTENSLIPKELLVENISFKDLFLYWIKNKL